ncbi:MAG TPA: SpoIIE family protein phosphatase [Candidatus Krumholzibacteria bacterium]|nr:SpoIIE family protein phosphatase [Candidatus Krumholzibacteria bacterium]
MLRSAGTPPGGGLLTSTARPLLPRSDRAARLAGLLLAAPLLVVLALPVAVRIARGPDLGFTVHELSVALVDAGGPAAAAGLEPGDRIEAIGLVPTPTMPAYFAAVAALHGTAPVEVRIQRDGVADLRVVEPRRPGQARMLRGYSIWLTGLAFLAIGWWVLLQRGDLVARNFFALCFIFAFFLLEVPDRPSMPYMHAKEFVRLLLQNLLPAYFVRFALLFPAPDRRSPVGAAHRVQTLLLLPALALSLLSATVDYILPQPPPGWAVSLAAGLTLVYALAFFAAGLVIFTRRILRRDRPIERSKMLVVLAGLVAGLVPFLAATALLTIAPAAASAVLQAMALSLVLVPVSFSLAILRYGALDRAFVVRAGITYGLLTLLVLGAFVLMVVGLGSLLSRAFDVSAYPVLLIIAAGSSLAIQPLRRVVQGWIDRTFYPARSVQRRAVTGLGEELAGVIELDDAVARLERRLEELFRPARLFVLLGAGSDTPLRPRGARDGDPLNLPCGAALVRLLSRLRRPVYAEEVDDLLLAEDADPPSLALMTRTGAQLLVPLVTGNRLVGILAFGPKAGGALYSQEDLANLRWLALQVASVLESRRLYQDLLRQERLEAELAVARDIQARLLPTAPLATPIYALAGRNDPCRAVGGDYFDYFLRENGHLGLAIGDVAGKGVPAALLMVTLATIFRSEAEGDAGPAAVMLALNQRMGDRITPGRFVSFFFADYDPESGLLAYCNAGMDPPVLLRPGRPREHLRKGGPVLGAAPDHPYREGTVRLQPGDQVFLHTDGLTDERNTAGEFYDLERLLAGLAAAADAEPDAALDQVFTAVSAFGEGEESDDKTGMLLQIKKLKNSLAPGPLLASEATDG